MSFELYEVAACNLHQLGLDANNVYEIICYKQSPSYYLIKSLYIPFGLSFENVRAYVINDCIANKEDLYRRYNSHMKTAEQDNIEVIRTEVEDDYSDDSLFNIASCGADLSFRELIAMYDEEELVKPELQRKYVWDKLEASRFIESILLGLPVPSIFLAQAGSQKLIVDGYQRIMTVHDYIRGIFTTDGKVFRLSNSEKINIRWRNKAFSELTRDEQRKLRSTTIHAIVFEQKQPENDDTSLYQIFERINTSGRTLTPQEIRNCVYQGSLNTLLFELNESPIWRKLFGTTTADSRMRDLEFILRFFLMKSDEVQQSTANKISLKKALNDFMGNHKNASVEQIAALRTDFINTMNAVNTCFGTRAFNNYSRGKFTHKFHPAIFDAVSVAVYQRLQNGQPIPAIKPEQHSLLLENSDFKSSISIRTTDIDSIRTRGRMVADLLAEA